MYIRPETTVYAIIVDDNGGIELVTDPESVYSKAGPMYVDTRTHLGKLDLMETKLHRYYYCGKLDDVSGPGPIIWKEYL
jgi:hypothetical protein